MNKVKNCELCGTTVPKHKTQSWRVYYLKRFCSVKCASNVVNKNNKPSEENRRAVSIANSGSRSHLWKGGVSSNRKEYFKMKALERQARLKGAEGSFTVEQWLDLKKRFNYCCASCGTPETIKKLTKDHVIPLTKGGSNFIDNIIPLCQSCNSRKGDKILAIYEQG